MQIIIEWDDSHRLDIGLKYRKLEMNWMFITTVKSQYIPEKKDTFLAMLYLALKADYSKRTRIFRSINLFISRLDFRNVNFVHSLRDAKYPKIVLNIMATALKLLKCMGNYSRFKLAGNDDTANYSLHG